jgi:hypothetical protein
VHSATRVGRLSRCALGSAPTSWINNDSFRRVGHDFLHAQLHKGGFSIAHCGVLRRKYPGTSPVGLRVCGWGGRHKRRDLHSSAKFLSSIDVSILNIQGQKEKFVLEDLFSSRLELRLLHKFEVMRLTLFKGFLSLGPQATTTTFRPSTPSNA